MHPTVRKIFTYTGLSLCGIAIGTIACAALTVAGPLVVSISTVAGCFALASVLAKV